MGNNDDTVECVCGLPQIFGGTKAETYLPHLREVAIDGERWLHVLACPRTGRQWLLDYPQGELHGGGPIRLRTFDQVCRDVTLELNAASAILTDDDLILADQLADALGACSYPSRAGDNR